MLIDMKDITKVYKTGTVETPVLHGIDLQIDEGEFVAIMGASGSGKSTLMNIMGFLDHLTSGTYHFNGKAVGKLSDDDLALMRRKEVGFVFQSFNLLARTSVLDNVVLPMIYDNIPSDKRMELAMKAIKNVGLSHRVNNLSNQLSGGERQRVSIARALVGDPTIIFADEPTGNLDSKTGEEVLKLFQKLNDEGNTIVMITHEIEAAEFSDRIITIRDGLILSDKKNHKRRTGLFTK